jgi:inner membrane protein
VVAIFMLVLNINTNGGMSASLNEILATPRGVQELMNQKGSTHQIIVSIDGVRAFDRARIKDDYVVVEQRDANTFLVHPLSTSDELYQVSNRPDLESQIVSERITGKVGQKVVTTIESGTWMDEEITPKLDRLLDRYPNAVMYLTGAIEIDDPEQITIRPDPQQLTTVIKQGRKLTFNSCPLANAIRLLQEQWGSGQIKIRVLINR